MKILLTILACIVVAAAGLVAFIYSGIYDVSATEPDVPIVAWALHAVSDHSINARLGDIVVPPGLDAAEMIQAGGHLFAQNCVVCHGGPGLKATNIRQGLNPAPPDLFRAGRKPSMAETFRFIKYGVKMTAMPGFAGTQTDEKIWQLVAFVQKAPGMSPTDFIAQTGIPTGTSQAVDAPVGG